MSLIRVHAIQLGEEQNFKSIDEDDEETKGGAAEAAYDSLNTEEDKASPGSPQLEFDEQKSSDDDDMHDDVEEIHVIRKERAPSDLESSTSSGYIKRLDDSQTDEDDFDQFKPVQRKHSNAMMVQKQAP